MWPFKKKPEEKRELLNIGIDDALCNVLLQNSSNTIVPMHLSNNELLEILCINGEYPQWNDKHTSEEIYKVLFLANMYLKEIVHWDCPSDYYKDENLFMLRPLSPRQISRSKAVLSCIIDKEYNKALHEFADCIDDYGAAYKHNKLISLSEFSTYKSIITCFMEQLEKNSLGNLKGNICKSIGTVVMDKTIEEYLGTNDVSIKTEFICRLFHCTVYHNQHTAAREFTIEEIYQILMNLFQRGTINKRTQGYVISLEDYL